MAARLGLSLSTTKPPRLVLLLPTISILNRRPLQYIQEDFVSERKATTSRDSAITSDDLIHRMITARFVSNLFPVSSIVFNLSS